MKLFLTLLCCSAAVYALPLKTNENEDIEFMKELEKLKDSKDKAVIKTEQVHSVHVNGDQATEAKQTVKVQPFSVADPKTGKVVASVEKTTAQKDGEPPQEKVEVHGPEEKAKKSAPDTLEQQGEPISADEVAAYLMETGDVDGFSAALNDQIQNKKVTKDEAQKYADSVSEIVVNMKEAEAHEQEKELDNEAMSGLFESVAKLDQVDKWQTQLYDLTKFLYIRSTFYGDSSARDNLNQFADLVKKEAEEGNMDKGLENHIYDIMLDAVGDVDKAEAEQEEREKEELEETDLQHLKN